jgi:PAS domain S-box-containing protein
LDQQKQKLKIVHTLLNLDIVHSDEGVNLLAEEIAALLLVQECSIFVFEKEKMAFRLIGTSVLDRSIVKQFKIREFNIPQIQDLRKGVSVFSEKEKLDIENRKFESSYLLMCPVLDDGVLDSLIVLGDEKIEKLQALDLHNFDFFRIIGKIIRLSIENRLLYENVGKLLGLTRLSEIVTKTDTVTLLYEKSLRMTCEVLNVENGSIWLANASGDLEISYWYGLTDDQLLKKTIPSGHGMVGWCFEHKRPMLSISVKKDPRAALDMLNINIKSSIAVPLFHENEIFGVIILINRKDQELYRPYKHFDEFDLALLEDFAARISLIVSKITYYEQLSHDYTELRELSASNESLLRSQEEQVRLLKNITFINRAMRESYDIQNIYAILLLGATEREGLGFDRVMLLTKDIKTQTLHARYWMYGKDRDSVETSDTPAMKYGNLPQYLREKAIMTDLKEYESEKLRNRSFPYKSHAIFEKVVLRKKIVSVTPEMVREWGNEYREITNLLETESFVVVPLIGRLETIAVLIVDNYNSHKEIKPHLLESLKIFADNAGLALENVQNYDELRAKTLSLERQTSLLNYHREFSQSILESLDVAIIVLDRENKIREWNRRSETLFQRSKEQVLGMGFDMLGPAVFDLLNVADRVYEVKNTVVLTKYEYTGREEKQFLDIKFTPLRSLEMARIEGIIIMFDDVTQKKLLEDEIRRQEKLASLGEMSARVAHEIRNPLSVIGGFANRLNVSIENGEKEKSAKYLEILNSEVERLEGIVEEILEFSRPSQRLDFEEFELSIIIGELKLFYQDKVEQKNIEFITDISDTPIFGDKKRIKQALINLIQNAIEACVSRISIIGYPKGDYYFCEVKNDGEKINEEVAKHLFSPFFTTKVTGTGLGLPITKKIIEEEHGGKLYVKGVEDPRIRETIFVMQLPIGTIPNQDAN